MKIKIKLHEELNSEFFEISIDGVSVFFDKYDFSHTGRLLVSSKDGARVAVFDEQIAKRFFDWVER